jgi:AraC-like DNA-binding protein
MDPLADVLAMASVRGSVAASLAAREPWGLALAPVPRAAFHAVTAGTVWMRVDGGPDVHLQPGDTVLLPRGSGHLISSGPDTPTLPFDHGDAEAALSSGVELTAGSGPVTSRILCASYQHDAPHGSGPFALLPDVVHVRGAAATPALSATVRLLAEEMASPAPGKRVVLDRIVDILLVHLLRAHISTADLATERPSWFRGLRDAVTSAALSEIHNDPGRAWTTDDLARHVGVSKATLARRFNSEVGQSPATYLTSWRMNVAAQLLRSESHPVATVARSVGYTSEFAFSRAFARTHGIPPGRYRRRERA